MVGNLTWDLSASSRDSLPCRVALAPCMNQPGPTQLVHERNWTWAWKQSQGCTSQTSSEQGHCCSGVPATALKSLSALAEANCPTGSSPPMTEDGGVLGTGPSWETWSSSGWLVTLSQAPFDLAQRSFIGRIHPIFLLLFFSRLMAGPLSPAPWSVPGSHFSKDWAYHSLPHSFVLTSLSHIFRFRKLARGWCAGDCEELVFRF